MSTRSGANYQIRALERSLDILEAFSTSDPELDLDAISARCDIPKTTVFRMLAILERRGYVQKSQGDGHYRIGFQAYEVGNRYLAGLTVFEVVHPVVKRLAARFARGSAHMAVLSPTEVRIVYLDIVSQNIHLPLMPVGSSFPALSTALGKCLLAWLPEEELERRLDRAEVKRLTPRTITDPLAVREHLDLVRTQGYAIDDDETALGNYCVAIPVLDRRGVPVAAVSTSHPKEAMTHPPSVVIDEMVQAAVGINRALGYVKPVE